MAITENDVRLYASERMTDFSDGGGAMSPTVIVDGLDNNVFPDVTDLDRVTGRASVRKVFGAVISADTDTYLSAHALLDDNADDTTVDAILFAAGGYETERAGAVAALEDWHRVPAAYVSARLSSSSTVLIGDAATTADTLYVPHSSGTSPPASAVAGQTFALYAGIPVVGPRLAQGRVVSCFYHHTVVQEFGGIIGYVWACVVDVRLPVLAASTGATAYFGAPLLEPQRAFGIAESPGAISSGATTVTVDGTDAQVVPYSGSGAYPTENYGIDPDAFAFANGRLPVLREGDALLIHSTIGMTPATVANAQVVTTGRTNLARLRVIGNNGVEHARFTVGVPAPAGVGCTANLAAGTVTFTDVSGMSQPVTVEHRIEEMALASSIAGLVVTLNRALSRAYPAGTKVSSLLMLGDLQGRVIGGFAQQAWTGVFSDTVLGGTPTADFNDAVYPITTTNKGSISDRWTIIFTNTTTFRCIGELTGEISGGNTGVAYAPINPATGAPYFTIPTLGWGTGWSAGNVYRFNTSGANAPLWLIRTVAPSAPSSASDSVTVEFRGYVNT